MERKDFIKSLSALAFTAPLAWACKGSLDEVNKINVRLLSETGLITFFHMITKNYNVIFFVTL